MGMRPVHEQPGALLHAVGLACIETDAWAGGVQRQVADGGGGDGGGVMVPVHVQSGAPEHMAGLACIAADAWAGGVQ